MRQNSCSKCGNSLRVGARFCNVCGAPTVQANKPDGDIAPPILPAQQVQAACPRCGRLLRPEAKFCAVCGQAIISSVPAMPLSMPGQLPPHDPYPVQSRRSSRSYLFLHGVIISVLLICILSMVGSAAILDLTAPTTTPLPTLVITPPPILSLIPPTASPSQRVVQIGISEDRRRFGLMTTNKDSLDASVRKKKLTFSEFGDTSNTRVWVDGAMPIFGEDGKLTTSGLQSDGSGSIVWEYNHIRVAQVLTYVLGAEERGDTIRIEYQLTNNDTITHEVGLRIMIDTLIGDNDGVPFMVPSLPGITEKAVDLQGSQVPDAIRALEIANIADPGVIVNLTLKGADATPPDRVVIAGWYHPDMDWDFLERVGGVGAPLRRGGDQDDTPDSAIGLFFEHQELLTGQTRTITTYYGLGSISSPNDETARLGLLGPNTVREGETFYLTAAIAQPQSGETVEIKLPDMLRLEADETALKNIEPTSAGYTQVSWLVRACKSAEDAAIQVILQPFNQTENWTFDIQTVGITRPGGVCP